MSAIRFVPAKQCPDTMAELKDFKENDKMFCCVIEKPTDSTDQIVKALIAEYGAHSKSYYNAYPMIREPGTGKGDATINSYVMPYLKHIHSGHYAGIFYFKSLQPFIEPKFTSSFAQDNKSTALTK